MGPIPKKFNKFKIVLLFFIFLLIQKQVSAFLSPSTLQLMAKIAGSSLWQIIILLIASLILFVKKIKKKIRILILLIFIFSLGFFLGNFFYRLSYLKKINVYAPLKQSDLDIITYDECIKNNYLNFLPTGNIMFLSEEDMISFLIENRSFNILNIGYSGEVRFKNEIVIPQSSNEMEELFIKTEDLTKSLPLIIHCYGLAHSSSMIAQFLVREGFSDIYLLKETNPEILKKRMKSLNINTKNYFKKVDKQSTSPIIRISSSTNLNLLGKNDIFFFYKINNCEDYMHPYLPFNPENTICSDEFNLNKIKQPIKSKVNFLCDEQEECRALELKLLLSDFEQIGVLVVLYE